MARSEAARCRAEYEWLPEITQQLHTLEIEGWDSLDFESKMASGGDRIGAVEWERNRCLERLKHGLIDLAGCPDPKNCMGTRQERECAHYREQLVRDQERLADLEERGDAACSDYDLRMGYNAEFNKQLKRNHIIYDLKQLERCPKPLMEMTPAVPEVLAVAPQPSTRKAPESKNEYTQTGLF
jgi:hypothetical protein